MTQGSCHIMHHVKSETITNTLSMKKFKQAIKFKTTKYQNKITKENDIYLYRRKVGSNLTEPQLYFMIKMSTNLIKHVIPLKQTDILG